LNYVKFIGYKFSRKKVVETVDKKLKRFNIGQKPISATWDKNELKKMAASFSWKG
jgi:hypothetical protein